MRRFRRQPILCVVACLLSLGSTSRAAWIEFVDETSLRLVADPVLGSLDPEEKDYAWGDVDNDGDIDLVIVRKEPFTRAGKRVNLLWLNEEGVLVDRTAEYTRSSFAGDLGFLTPTNDRDVLLEDLDGDGWLDIVTATTISDGDPKVVGHPRVYINLGSDGDTGEWLGFLHEDERIPPLLTYSGEPGFNPRFCSVAGGDVTGDGFPDLWFSDYDSGAELGSAAPEGSDFNDRLLVNDGSGFFTDETGRRLSWRISIPDGDPVAFRISNFGASAVIEDMNGDGLNDIVKQTSLVEPFYVGVAYNTPDEEGFFDTYEVVAQNSPYFVTVGDLNNDGRPDLVVSDDGFDFFLLNLGNGIDGLADFATRGFQFDVGTDDGFGGNSVIADLDRDGWNDVLIADVDVDTPGCGRRLHIYRNLGGMPGGTVSLRELRDGPGCDAGDLGTCFIAGLSPYELSGVHDVAVFDLDGDEWLDLILGRCDGTTVLINRPPNEVRFAYPDGLPAFIHPVTPTKLAIELSPFGEVSPLPGSARLLAAVGDGPFEEQTLIDLGNDRYEATLPTASCGERVRFYVSGEGSDNSGTFFDPPGAPAKVHERVAAFGVAQVFADGFESEVAGWTVVNDPALDTGGWERAEPVGTLDIQGQLAAPNDDAQLTTQTTHAFVTENGETDGPEGAADVDGGPTDLISPVLDLAGTDSTIHYARWFYTSRATRPLVISITNDGVDWVTVDELRKTIGYWEQASLHVADYVEPSANVQVRFRVSDENNLALLEAGVDDFRVERLVCEECATAAECDDGRFCSGVELCTAGGCAQGRSPCPGQVCDEASATCVPCLVDEDCNDGVYCNGVEACLAGSCASVDPPCSGGLCDETADRCVECLSAADCDDGAFCSGTEFCVAGACREGVPACPGACDERAEVCTGDVLLQPTLGEPLRELDTDQLQRFLGGRAAFGNPLTTAEGLGPIFNKNSCGNCHNAPLGGSGSQRVTRFGFSDPREGTFDPLTDLGGSLRQSEAIRTECSEVIPPQANVTAQRLTTSTLGAGLIEAIADDAIEANALWPPGPVSGRVHWVEPLEAPGTVRAGRFGWKSQIASVLSFSADAATNEMGLTNRLLPSENAPNGDAVLLASCDDHADPEDRADVEGLEFIDRVTDFQRYLAPPPQTPRSGMTGEIVFHDIGCAACHVRSFATTDDGEVEEALRGKRIQPYSDFLLHDMGASADFMAQGDASGREMRTPPLWGVRIRTPLWHDGRILGGSFSERMQAAIALHDQLGSEAGSAARAFQALPQQDRATLISFLDSLGRAEFDQDGDGVVNEVDFAAFEVCAAASGPLTPDDPCSVSDVDQDGDVDDQDFQLFLAAATGFAGRVPDGATAPGQMLTVEREGTAGLRLSWGPSCRSSDLDYGVYEGVLGDFTSHASRICSTDGQTESNLVPAAGSTYYLVVPSNGFREGSYGQTSQGVSRPSGADACFEQSVAECGGPLP